MLYSDLMSEIYDSIRAYYYVGHFGLEEALSRIQNSGTVTLPREQAMEILRESISVDRAQQFTRRDVTEELIAARLAEVHA